MFDGINNLIRQLTEGVGSSASLVIGLVATAVGVLTLVKSISSFGKKNMKEGITYMGLTILIGIIAFVGIGGFFALANSTKPTGFEGGYSFSMSQDAVGSGGVLPAPGVAS